MIATRMEMLTPTEAAVVSGISDRNANRAIDEKILPEIYYRVDPNGTRQFKADACVFLSFYFNMAKRLTAEERLRIIAFASKQLSEVPESILEKQWLIRQEFLMIDLAPFLRGVRERMAKLVAAYALVVEDPEVLSGTSVLRGTRIPVYDVAFLVKAGEPLERILEDYPSLTAETLELSAIYAEADPRRGRRCVSHSLPAGATVVTSHRVPANRSVFEKMAS